MSLTETLVETATPASSPTTALPVVTAPGIEAWHVESPVVPLIALAFTFEGGAAQDPAASRAARRCWRGSSTRARAT